MRLLRSLGQISACCFAVAEGIGLVFRMLLCGCCGVWDIFQRVAMRLLGCLVSCLECCYAVAEVFGLVFSMLLCGC